MQHKLATLVLSLLCSLFSMLPTLPVFAETETLRETLVWDRASDSDGDSAGATRCAGTDGNNKTSSPNAYATFEMSCQLGAQKQARAFSAFELNFDPIPDLLVQAGFDDNRMSPAPLEHTFHFHGVAVSVTFVGYSSEAFMSVHSIAPANSGFSLVTTPRGEHYRYPNLNGVQIVDANGTAQELICACKIGLRTLANYEAIWVIPQPK